MRDELEGSSLWRGTHIGGWVGGRESEGKGVWNGGRQVAVGGRYEWEGRSVRARLAGMEGERGRVEMGGREKG